MVPGPGTGGTVSSAGSAGDVSGADGFGAAVAAGRVSAGEVSAADGFGAAVSGASITPSVSSSSSSRVMILTLDEANFMG